MPKRLLRPSLVVVLIPIILVICLGLGVLFGVNGQRVFIKDQQVIPLPILMYHSVLRDPARAGKFVVSPSTLENDLRYLREHGYTTVVMADLIAYVQRGIPLPDKPVVLTFDDGCLNLLTYVLPLLDEYDMKAVVSIVGEYTVRYSTTQLDHNPNYAYLNYDDLHIMADSGRIELQNHSYDMHRTKGRYGITKKRGESKADYQAALTADLTKLQDLFTDQHLPLPTTFAYPFGLNNQEAHEVLLAMGFSASLTCNEHINAITTDPNCLFFLGRYNRPSGPSTEDYMKKRGIF